MDYVCACELKASLAVKIQHVFLYNHFTFGYLLCVLTVGMYHPSKQNEAGKFLVQLFHLPVFSSHKQLVTVWDPLENESSPRVTVLRIQINGGAEGKVDWMWTSLKWLKCNPVHLWSKQHLSITTGQQKKHSCSWIVSIQPLPSKLVYVVSWFLISGFEFGHVAVALLVFVQ